MAKVLSLLAVVLLFWGASSRVYAEIDETKYASMKFADLSDLFKTSQHPVVESLLNQSWVCSGYPFAGAASIDFKTRKYFVSKNEGLLFSVTSISDKPALWMMTELGLVTTREKIELCGAQIDRFYIWKQTPNGNLLGEVTFDKNAVKSACKGNTLRQFLREPKNASAIDPEKMLAISREFCRPARL